MKALSLLISLPFLLTTMAANAMPRDSGSTTSATTRPDTGASMVPITEADLARWKNSDRLVPADLELPNPGRSELRTIRARGGMRRMEIMTDQYHVRHL